ncbi:Alpha-1,3-mannosyl-glycoprotein 2-beta-N-acetylglucosaminyltransferase [Trichinella pseudospiralis]|uniref:Alpha-1,3-mannosyl-glycoprotein 2-beta-N-acetylglucosaminyltransferase n=1 Tax=Trichinella pseudospiralis TaxID=6337 RepID=A0A0V1IB47_TRIPS|nr:Alpha-1,3-mannosyl-glycoprotein 2-beta-N-acetylglucosaminyltransferase [Trichinella pseudospiralis]
MFGRASFLYRIFSKMLFTIICIVYIFAMITYYIHYMPSHPCSDCNLKNLNHTIADLETQITDNRKLLNRLAASMIHFKQSHENTNKLSVNFTIIPLQQIAVLVIACNRPNAVKSLLQQLLKFRPCPKRYPIIVSQDCNDKATEKAIQAFHPHILHIKTNFKEEVQSNQADFIGYYRISRHYKWALKKVFDVLQYDNVIILEDDLSIAEDFFEYFAATLKILQADPTLFCVSAWNDNGKSFLIQNDPQLLHRSDFFPGLGWMMTRLLWEELKDKWPEGFWDDWLREADQRKDRACIRPEISRTAMTEYGKNGVSRSQFYENYLKQIKLNEKFIPFTQLDLRYLLKENYDKAMWNTINSLKEITSDELDHQHCSLQESVRIKYASNTEFQRIAAKLQLMEDFKHRIYIYNPSNALISLAFSGCVGLLFLVLGCALPIYNSWYPLFVIIFYILAPIPLTVASRVQDRVSAGGAASCQEFALFLTAGIIVSAFSLPIVLARSPAENPVIHWGACGFALAGNITCFFTIAAYFYIHREEDARYGLF